jgi:glycosyltransferase involved in cell wall biosynthesis
MIAPNSSTTSNSIELSIVMPCLNEAKTLGVCIEKAQSFLRRAEIDGEIIVADNGSTDGTREIAHALGARVVPVPIRGYGAALMTGIESAHGRFVIMGDSDDTYDFSKLDGFIEQLRAGHDIVLGNRFRGGIHEGAMPALHQYLGNPVLTFLARFFFDTPSGDVYCGLRGFTKEAYERMKLQSLGMEFALEMVVKATLTKLRIAEVATTLSPDAEGREPHLRSWRDGRRSLRLYLFCSPNWLFLIPGIGMLIAGFVSGAQLILGPVHFGGVGFDIHTLAYSAAAILIGAQAIWFYMFAKMLALGLGLIPDDERFARLIKAFHLEHGVACGAFIFLAGIAAALYGVFLWRQEGYGDLDPFVMMRLTIPSALAMALGVQITLSSLFVSLLKAFWRRSLTPTARYQAQIRPPDGPVPE